MTLSPSPLSSCYTALLLPLSYASLYSALLTRLVYLHSLHKDLYKLPSLYQGLLLCFTVLVQVSLTTQALLVLSLFCVLHQWGEQDCAGEPGPLPRLGPAGPAHLLLPAAAAVLHLLPGSPPQTQTGAQTGGGNFTSAALNTLAITLARNPTVLFPEVPEAVLRAGGGMALLPSVRAGLGRLDRCRTRVRAVLQVGPIHLVDNIIFLNDSRRIPHSVVENQIFTPRLKHKKLLIHKNQRKTI